MKTIEKEYLERRIEELKPWYHKIDLGKGIITPGRDFEQHWGQISNLMDSVDYRGKTVLDLASWDGAWAFEAEKRGASMVVATDIFLRGLDNFLFVREVLGSKVIPLYNVSANRLTENLNAIGLPSKFDIIHHFGLLYHLRDPLASLTEVRKNLSDEGLLMLETAFLNNDKDSYMLFSGLPGDYNFYGESDTWAPTLRCLKDMLIRSYLKPFDQRDWSHFIPKVSAKRKWKVGRIALKACCLSESEGTQADKEKNFLMS